MRVILAFFSSWTNWIWLIKDSLALWHYSTYSNSVGVLGQVSIVSHSYQTYFDFPKSNLNLDCGLRDHVIRRFALVSIRARLRNKVISLCYFRFFSVPFKFFSVLRLSSYSLCLRHLRKKKEEGVIFHLVTASNHISILKIRKREREREREISWNLKDLSIFAAETQLLMNHKKTTSESIETSYSVY